MGVVDRHHYVDPELVGRHGTARFVYLLSSLALQPTGQQRQGIIADGRTPGHISTAPPAYGRVVAVPGWQLQRGVLPYETLFTELLLDVGDGVIGVRTSLTADDIAARIGTPALKSGDWLAVGRSRIDILGFEPSG